MCSPPGFWAWQEDRLGPGNWGGGGACVRERGREGGHCVTASFSRCCCTLEPASRASHEWLCSAGRVPPPQDAVLFTQLAWLEVEASTCPSVASSVGPSCQTADQCSCPRRPPPPQPRPLCSRWWGLLMDRWKRPTAPLSRTPWGSPRPTLPTPGMHISWNLARGVSLAFYG